MKNNNITNYFIGFCIGLFFGSIITAITLGYKQNKEKENNSKIPVEEIKVDTLYITRDSIIYRTKYLETIKHDTIEKVYRLNDSSSIDLFLQLVSE